MPNSVKHISKKEHGNCDRLNTLVIPETVESIEEGTFANCIDLKNVKADPKWLNKLSKSTIETMVISNWVTEVHEKDFEGCYHLREVIFENDNTKLCGESCDAFEHIEVVKCFAKTALSMSKNAKENLKKLEIKEGTIDIVQELNGFYNLQEIELPETLKRIDKDAFKQNIKLKEVCCCLDLLKYLPKNQIETIKLKYENIDINKVTENECKGYKNLEKIIYNKNGWCMTHFVLKNINKPCDKPNNNESEYGFRHAKRLGSLKETPKVEKKVDLVSKEQEVKPTMVDQIVAADKNNEKYAEHIRRIRKAIEDYDTSKKSIKDNRNDCSLNGNK